MKKANMIMLFKYVMSFEVNVSTMLISIWM